jgi:hypothetical protein
MQHISKKHSSKSGKRHSQKEFKNPSSESDNSTEDEQLSPEMKVYTDAYNYFENEVNAVDTRNDIASRYSYLGYYIDHNGKVKTKKEQGTPDDHCCKLLVNDVTDNSLMMYIGAVSLERNKYAKLWGCTEKIFLKDFKTIEQIREWVISGRCIPCQEKAFALNKKIYGELIRDIIICHNLHGNEPKNSYDLCYTYITRIINEDQMKICSDPACPCFPKDFTQDKVFNININVYQKYKRNESCPCGSGKKYKKCCLGDNMLTETPKKIEQYKPEIAAQNAAIKSKPEIAAQGAAIKSKPKIAAQGVDKKKTKNKKESIDDILKSVDEEIYTIKSSTK